MKGHLQRRRPQSLEQKVAIAKVGREKRLPLVVSFLQKPKRPLWRRITWCCFFQRKTNSNKNEVGNKMFFLFSPTIKNKTHVFPQQNKHVCFKANPVRLSLHSKEVTTSCERNESSLPSYTGLLGPKIRWKAFGAKVKQAHIYRASEAHNTVKWQSVGVMDELWVAHLPLCSTNIVHLPAKFHSSLHWNCAACRPFAQQYPDISALARIASHMHRY